MTDISINSVLQHKDVKDTFDKEFVSSFLDKIPEIMKLTENELTLGHIASITDQPRAIVGRFLQAASNMKNFPIGIVNRTPVIKKVSKKAPVKKIENKPESAHQTQQFNMSDVANAIIEALRKEPVGSSDKRYASVETLSDELDVPEDFISKVINSLQKRNIISLYEGENDFDEVVFFLNPEGFAEATAKAKETKSQKDNAPTRTVDSKKETKNKEETSPESSTRTEKRNKNVSSSDDIDLLSLNVPRKTMNAVIAAMTNDKFTRNGILKEVAQKGVHQRNHVDAAFRQLVDSGKAVPTNDGGARSYFTVPQEDKKEQLEEQVVSIKSTPVPAEDTTLVAKTESVAVTRSDNDVDAAIINSLSTLINSAAESLKEGISSSDDIDKLLAKVKSAEHMLMAAKALK